MSHLFNKIVFFFKQMFVKFIHIINVMFLFYTTIERIDNFISLSEMDTHILHNIILYTYIVKRIIVFYKLQYFNYTVNWQ